MSQADELLKSLLGVKNVSRLVTPMLEDHIVIDENRFITVPEPLKRIGVQYDHNIETVTFDCPRYWDGIDLSTMKIYINYMRADKGPGSFLAENVSVDENDDTIMHFTWTVSNYATQVKGPLIFLVCARRVDEDGNESNHWNTELNKDMYISEGLECHDPIIHANPEIFTQLLQQMDITINTAEDLKNTTITITEGFKNTALKAMNQANMSATDAEEKASYCLKQADLVKQYSEYAKTELEEVQNLNQEVRQLIDEGKTVGPQGPQGDKGDKGDTGPQGPQGDNGVITTIGGMYGLGIDPDGNLCVYSNEEESAPSFEIDANGDLYMLMEVDEDGN